MEMSGHKSDAKHYVLKPFLSPFVKMSYFSYAKFGN